MIRWLRQHVKLFSALVGIVFIISLAHGLGALSWLEKPVIAGLAPLQQWVYSVGTHINRFYLGRAEFTDPANPQIQTEHYAALLVENAQLKTRLETAQQATQQSDFLTAMGLRAIQARVLGKSYDTDLQLLIIDKGESDGISVGMPVVGGSGILVGKIVSVANQSAQALLITDSHSSIAALVQNERKTNGLVVGSRGLSIQLELVPHDEQLKEGDTVITSGLEVEIPQGLVIGQIERIVIEENSFFQKALLRPLVSFDDLLVVSVLIPIRHE